MGNAIASAYELQVKHLYPDRFEELSRLFIYYNARTIDGSTIQDTGTTIRAALIATHGFGVCAERLWPYDITKFDDKPSAEAYVDAMHRLVKNYRKLNTDQDMMDALAAGYPVVIAFEVFGGFMKLKGPDATIPMPRPWDSAYYGGHAVSVVGYSKARSAWLIKNSFGTDWGDQGYCWMPFEYADRYLFERWVFDISEQPAIV